MKRTIWAFAVLDVFLFAVAAQAQWTPAKRITWTPDYSDLGKIAVDSFGVLHVVWEDDAWYLLYKKSTDGGVTWTVSQKLAGGELESSLDIAADSHGNIHVVFAEDFGPGGYWDIRYTKSTDGGATWAATRFLTLATHSEQPEIFADSLTNLYVTFVDSISGDYVPYYKKSTDNTSGAL